MDMIALYTEELSFNSFLEFIARQPGSKTIEHNSWQQCAVGDWVRDQEFVSATPEEMEVIIDNGATLLYRECEVLYDYLNEKEPYDYDDLQTFIRENVS